MDSAPEESQLPTIEAFKQDPKISIRAAAKIESFETCPDDDVITPHQDVITPHQDVITPHQDVITPHQDVMLCLFVENPQNQRNT